MNHKTHTDHKKHHAGQHVHTEDCHMPESNFKLALSATLHCLIGCGLGEVLGMIIGTALGMPNVPNMILALSLGAVLGLLLGMRPLLKADYSFGAALKQTLMAEGLSIAVMEAAEAIAEWNIPGLMDAKLYDALFWYGMIAALAVGFIAALPVNYALVKRGVRHVH
jgi:hypothetical protein